MATTPLTVRDFNVEQTADSVLESAQIARMHYVDCDVVQLEAWGPEKERWVHPFVCEHHHVPLMVHQGSPVGGLGSEVVVMIGPYCFLRQS